MTDTLIVIGAGNEPDQYLQQGYERVILIEPHPRLAVSLRQKIPGSAAEVGEFAVVTDASLNHLHEFNLPEVSSVRQPSGLKQLVAGLRHKTSHSVATMTPAELCRHYGLEEEGRHKLVVLASGEEVNIILSLIESGDLACFQQLTFGGRRTAYYYGEKTIDAVTDALQKLGFEGQPVKRYDPDWPVWKFETNHLSRVVEQLRKELDGVRKSSMQNEELFHKHKDMAENAKSQLSEQRIQHQELLASFEKLQTENDRLLSERQALEEKNVRISELQAALNEEVEQCRAEKQKNLEIASQVQNLTVQINETAEQLKSKNQKIAELSKQLEDRNYKVELMRQEVVKVQAQIELIKDVVVREKAF